MLPYMLRAGWVLAAATLFCGPAYGQRGGGSTQQGGGIAGGGTRGGPSGQNPDGVSQAPGPPIFLTGRVMLEDGSVPEGRVTVLVLCSARPRVQGYVDAKGYFTIQVGSPSPDVFDDASVGAFPGPANGIPSETGGTYGGSRAIAARDLIGCELRAQLAGYDSQSIELGRRQTLDNPNVGTILMRRLGGGADGTTVSASTLAAPKDARRAYDKGLDFAKKGRLAEAQTSFEKAVGAYSQYAVAWAELGKVQAAQNEWDAARNSFNQAIAADRRFVVPYVEMSEVEFHAREWQPLADTTEKAIALDSFHYPQVFFLNAVANYNLHNLDRAEDSVRRAQKLDVNHHIPQISELAERIQADRRTSSQATAQ
jgi:Tetratricopeptide repeat